jgi:hypothetical protein
VAGIAIISLSLLVWRMRKYKKDKALTAVEAAGPDLMRQGKSDMSSIPPYAYSARSELQTITPIRYRYLVDICPTPERNPQSKRSRPVFFESSKILSYNFIGVVIHLP